MAPVAHVLFNKIMTYNPKNPKWLNRDRFVLSSVTPTLSLILFLPYRTMDIISERPLFSGRFRG
jgi:transketolase